MNAVARSFGARALSFVPTALATLLASRLIIENYGILAFNSFALILSLINLIPLNNLGVGAAITAALAEGGAGSTRAERTVLTASRVLAVSSAATAVLALLLSALGLWRPLLGESSGPELWVGVALVVYALTFLPGLGQSMLLGVHRNHVTILVQTFFNPLNALLVGIIVLTGADDGVLVLVPCVSLLLVNLVTAGLAARATRISWRRIARRLARPRRFPGASIRSMSGPVLVLTLSTPIALQSDRIVLSHVSTADAVAQYSVALQIFGPALVLVAASAQPLWPIWAQARAAGRRGPSVVRIAVLFAGAGIAVGAVLALLSGPVARLVAGSQVQISPLLALAGALGVLTAALSQPIAMSLMYPAGLKVVVWCTLLALPLNIGLSIVLGHHLGAPGPLFASCIAGVLVQALPGLVVSMRRQRRGDYGPLTDPDPATAPANAADALDADAEPFADRELPAIRPFRPFAPAAGPEHAGSHRWGGAATTQPPALPAPVSVRVPEAAARPRPRPGPGPGRPGRSVPRHAARPEDAAAALATALSGATGIGAATDVSDEPPTPPPPPAAKLQPVAPFRRPRDRRQP